MEKQRLRSRGIFKKHYLHRNLKELIDAFLKARLLALCGHTWWRKPENPGKTIDLGRKTTTILPHADTGIRSQIAEVTSKCVNKYIVKELYSENKGADQLI